MVMVAGSWFDGVRLVVWSELVVFDDTFRDVSLTFECHHTCWKREGDPGKHPGLTVVMLEERRVAAVSNHTGFELLTACNPSRTGQHRERRVCLHNGRSKCVNT